jgi:hypothetical protein
MSASAAIVHIKVMRLDFRLRVDMIVPPLDRLECGGATVRGSLEAVKALDRAVCQGTQEVAMAGRSLGGYPKTEIPGSIGEDE